MSERFVHIYLSEREAQLLSVGLRNPLVLQEGIVNRPEVRHTLRSIGARINRSLARADQAPLHPEEDYDELPF